MVSFTEWFKEKEAIDLGIDDTSIDQSLNPTDKGYYKNWYQTTKSKPTPAAFVRSLLPTAGETLKKELEKDPTQETNKKAYTQIIAFMDKMFFDLTAYNNGLTVGPTLTRQNSSTAVTKKITFNKVPSVINFFNFLYWESCNYLKNTTKDRIVPAKQYYDTAVGTVEKYQIITEMMNTLFPDPIEGQPFITSSEIANFRVNHLLQNIGSTFRNARWWRETGITATFPLETVVNWGSPYFNNAEWITSSSGRAGDGSNFLPGPTEIKRFLQYRNPFVSPRYDALRPENGGYGMFNIAGGKPHFVWPLTQNMMDTACTFVAAGGILPQSRTGAAMNVSLPKFESGSGEEIPNQTLSVPLTSKNGISMEYKMFYGSETFQYQFGPFSVMGGGQLLDQLRREWTWSEIWAFSFIDEIQYLSLIISNFFKLYSEFKKQKLQIDTTEKNLKLGIYEKNKALCFLSSDTSDNITTSYQELTTSSGFKAYRMCTEGKWSEWLRSDVDSLGIKSFEINYGDLNVVQLGSRAALTASFNGTGEYNQELPPQKANQKWTIYTRDVNLNGLPESLRYGADKYHSNDSGINSRSQDTLLATIVKTQSKINKSTAEYMYDRRFNFYYNGGYVPPTKHAQYIIDPESYSPYGDWVKERYTNESPRPPEEQIRGIMECLYNGYEYVQEWEPIGTSAPFYEPYINRSRYKYRRTGKDVVVSLTDNAAEEDEDVFYSIEWSAWGRIDNCESVKSLGSINWQTLYINNRDKFPYRKGQIGKTGTHGEEIDIVTNFYEIFKQPIDTIYYVLIDNSQGWYQNDQPGFNKLNRRYNQPALGEIAGLPDVSLEKGPGRHLMQEMKSSGLGVSPWGDHYYKIKFNFKYGILISNKNSKRPYMEFRDLGNILNKTKVIGTPPTLDYEVYKSGGFVKYTQSLPMALITGKPMRFSYKEFGSDFYYYKEGTLFENITMWGPWHSIDSRLISLESRMNIIEWFVGIPPGVELSGPVPKDNYSLQDCSDSNVYKVESSYKLRRSFHHEISGTVMMRLGLDPRNLSNSSPAECFWYKGKIAKMHSLLTDKFRGKSILGFNYGTMICNLIDRTIPPMLGQVPPQKGAVPDQSEWSPGNRFYDPTIFGWIYELYYRTNITYQILPVIIVLKVFATMIEQILNYLIKYIVNPICQVIKLIPRVRWYWIGISFSWYNPKKMDLYALDDYNPVIPPEEGIQFLEEVQDMRNENFPELGERSAEGFDVVKDFNLDLNAIAPITEDPPTTVPPVEDMN